MTFYVGSEASARVAFRNDAGVATDPTSVVIKVKAPDGSVSTYTYPADGVVKESTGIYRKDFICTMARQWTVRAEGSGALIAAYEDYFDVRPTAF